MKLHTKHILLACAAFALGACTRNDADDIKFRVQAENLTVQAGQPVNFQFDGNPDYIVFYPGTKQCSYANSNRTEILLDSLGITFGFSQMYTTPEVYNNLDESLMTVWITDNYTGDPATTTWEQIGGKAEHILQTPRPEGDKAVNVNCDPEDNCANLSHYLGKQFFIAFHYKAAPNPIENTSYGKPRIEIKDLALAKREPDGNVIWMNDCVNDWGFLTVHMLPTEGIGSSKYDIGKNLLFFSPDKSQKEDEHDVWMISTLLNPTAVLPDKGMPIKATNARLDSYSFVYDQPGTYTATFIASNANMWDVNRSVRELTITVTE